MRVLPLVLLLPECVVSVVRPPGERRRATTPQAVFQFAQGASQLSVLGLCLAAGWWVPLPQTESVWLQVGVGVALAALLTRGWGAVQRDLHAMKHATPPKAAEYARLWVPFVARGRLARLALLMRAVCTSTTEEVARFIVVLGPTGDDLSVGSVAFGVVFNVVLHLYQGRKHAWMHAVFALLSIFTIARLGLLTAIALHITWNVLIDLRMREVLVYLRQLRAYERAVTSARRASESGADHSAPTTPASPPHARA
ncbi:MAG: hypothetical protein QM817_26570 [Archangium sp.]